MSRPAGSTTLEGAEGTYTKAAKAELERDLDRAFRLYLKAAEDFLFLMGTAAQDNSLRTRCRTEAAKALERAEKIKLVRRDLTPVPKNHFSPHEQSHVLRKSSLINGIRYSLWDEDAPDDLSQPKLSPEQEKEGAVWSRPDIDTELKDPAYSTTVALLPQDIIQHVISDCSVCGSIVLGLASVFPKLLEDPPRHPQASGRHSLRFLFNGAYRRISIDDQLPTHPDGSLMCMSAGPGGPLWPALVEKAYMKLMGGYDFPGSNSSYDLHAIAGWIPEHIDLSSPAYKRERTWARIIAGFTSGRCVLTLGTGKVVSPNVIGISLLPAHCYAVIDVQEAGEERTLTILDAWVQPPTTEASGSTIQRNSATNGDKPDHSRAIAVSWDSVHDLFEGIYLSWDPGIFRHELSYHGVWQPKGAPGSDDRTAHATLLARIPEGAVPPAGENVWVLLTRHAADTALAAEYTALLANDADQTGLEPAKLGAVALCGAYSTGIHTLAKVQITPATRKLCVVASYEGACAEAGFTVAVYSGAPLSWAEDPPKALFSREIDGAFTSRNSGGNFGFPTAMNNPQYHLRIHPSAEPSGKAQKPRATLMVQAARRLPVNITLVWSKGERVSEFGRNDIALASGPYSYGCAYAKGCLPPGDYTVILSTFEPQQTGSFALKVECAARVDVTPIPQEGAGMFSKIVRGAWTAETAGGAPSFHHYSRNPKYLVKVARPCQLRLRLQLEKPRSAISTNITLFETTGESLTGPLVATSGPYSDAVAGSIVPQVSVQAGTYLAVPSTYNQGIEGAFTLYVYSTDSVEVTIA